jgi:hypothetical protein
VLLVRNKSDEMCQSSIRINGLKTLKSGDKPRARPSAHDDFVRTARHCGFASWVAIDSCGLGIKGLGINRMASAARVFDTHDRRTRTSWWAVRGRTTWADRAGWSPALPAGGTLGTSHPTMASDAHYLPWPYR